MAASDKISLVIFDCDGVLVDSEVISARMLKEEARELGVDLELDYIMKHHVGRSYPTVFADICKLAGRAIDPVFEENYRNRLLCAFEKELAIMPGVLGVLDQLEAMRLPYCMATSSSPRRASRTLEITGLAERFRGRVYTASMVKNGKPAPDLFLHAAKEMGVLPQKSLIIEDSLTGIAAALAAGAHTARFVGGSHLLGTCDNGGAELVFDKFSDLFNYYPQLGKGEQFV